MVGKRDVPEDVRDAAIMVLLSVLGDGISDISKIIGNDSLTKSDIKKIQTKSSKALFMVTLISIYFVTENEPEMRSEVDKMIDYLRENGGEEEMGALALLAHMTVDTIYLKDSGS